MLFRSCSVLRGVVRVVVDTENERADGAGRDLTGFCAVHDYPTEGRVMLWLVAGPVILSGVSQGVVEGVDGLGLLFDACLGVHVFAHVESMAWLVGHGFSFDVEVIEQ